jgi:hypothetical protein
MRGRLIFICIGAGSVLLACSGLGGQSFIPGIPGYEEGKRERILLKRPLREISGISYIGNNQLAAINDEEGKLFIMDATTGKQQHTAFGKKGDYEDVVWLNDFYYVLKSNGHLYKINKNTYQEEAVY